MRLDIMCVNEHGSFGFVIIHKTTITGSHCNNFGGVFVSILISLLQT